MNGYLAYIMYSSKFDKTYIGQTGNLIARFKDHNELGKKGWTTKYRPWKVVHVEFYKTRSEALAREKFLKTGRGREWIKQNIS